VSAAAAVILLAALAVTGRLVAVRPEAGPASTTPATTAAASPVPTQPSPVVATIATGGFSYGMAVGAGSLWVAGSAQVTRIGLADNRVAATIPVGASGSGLTGVAFGAGAVWVPMAVPGTLWAIDPASNKVTRIPLGGPLRGLISVSATGGAVWVACCGESAPGGGARGKLFRVDPRRGRVVAEIALPASPTAVAADPSAAWVATASGRVLVIDPKRNRVADGVDVGGSLGFSQTIAVGAGGVWLAEPFAEQVVRIDPKTRKVVATIPAGAATTLAVASDAVWVISSLGLLRVDPAHDRVVASAPGADLRRAQLITAGSGAVWTAAWNSVSRIDPDRVAP
jgi:uncharacterized protein DUF6923